jgi:hypothetical protein
MSGQRVCIVYTKSWYNTFQFRERKLQYQVLKPLSYLYDYCWSQRCHWAAELVMVVVMVKTQQRYERGSIPLLLWVVSYRPPWKQTLRLLAVLLHTRTPTPPPLKWRHKCLNNRDVGLLLLLSYFTTLYQTNWPPLWSSGQSSWLQDQRSAFDFLRY